MEQTLQNPPVPGELKSNILITTIDKLYNWGRKRSTWPMGFGLACCAFEMIATAAARYDIARFGMELFRASPRQADLMVVAGTVTKKMLPQIVRLYNQIAEPKYIIAMGACAISGGPFKEGYGVVSGIDKYIPVDVYIPGCPPKPESLLQGFLKLFETMDSQSIRSVPWYQKTGSVGVPVPILGPDVFDWRRLEELKAHSATAPAGEAALAESVGALEQDTGTLDMRENLS
ncbi:MAG: NADH-quinone oxidoreductase subunit NuoB [Thermoflexales bacterium]|nr:NADH-quinone oxidoreductase subunit NuoB [Thermoflexales bacterium]